jgi:hypothetical protein
MDCAIFRLTQKVKKWHKTTIFTKKTLKAERFWRKRGNNGLF